MERGKKRSLIYGTTILRYDEGILDENIFTQNMLDWYGPLNNP